MPKSLLRILVLVFLTTATASAQTYADVDLTRADAMLERVYDSIFERAGIFVSIACLIGAMGAIVMISTHIYGRMLDRKSIYLSEITRPLVIMAALILYTPLVNTVNLVLSPTLTASKALVNGERDVLDNVLEEMLNNDVENGRYDAYVGDLGEGSFDKYIEAYGLEDEAGFMGTDRIGQFLSWRIESHMYKIRWAIRNALFWLLAFLYTAVVFCLSAVRTFTLSVLALVGPLALGFSLWKPFSSSFATWLGRYIGVYLWLPVANIFGFLITTVMTEFNLVHLETVQATGTDMGLSSLDIMYAIMLVTGIVGYIAVPSITAYVITASGASSLLSGAAGAGKMAAGAVGGAVMTGGGAVLGSVISGGGSVASAAGSGVSSVASSEASAGSSQVPRLGPGRPSR
ncbi:hypothetical protein LEM8419_03416 [Neolewinella maritima]|uniref:Conjugative transposon TraJ C-terminal domain-containing protein n=1 Tax=Neolewinella maritima TaxID=1383882 RepID=A0ABM9B5D8_9BACT|nr:hypothetical protein [Neolewinella maritima]CAH1002542.1 hypothetical protein LEM8419_03416 [Neolewinella maritima]